jgi:hypothetical protein
MLCAAEGVSGHDDYDGDGGDDVFFAVTSSDI